MYVNQQSGALAKEGCKWQTIASTKGFTQTNSARIPKRPFLLEFISQHHYRPIRRISRLLLELFRGHVGQSPSKRNYLSVFYLVLNRHYLPSTINPFHWPAILYESPFTSNRGTGLAQRIGHSLLPINNRHRHHGRHLTTMIINYV